MTWYSEGMRVVVIQCPHEYYGNKGTITGVSKRKLTIEIDFGGGEIEIKRGDKNVRITGRKKKISEASSASGAQ